jgi:hypothetical protein
MFRGLYVKGAMAAMLLALAAGMAQAEIVPVVSGQIPAGCLSFTVTAYDSSLNCWEFHLSGWITGTHEELQLLEGTWTALGWDHAVIYLGGTGLTWKSRTSNNGFAGQPGPQSYVNFDSVTSGATWNWTGPGAVNNSFTGSWYTTQSAGPDARLMPVIPPENVGLFDNTLLAKIYVSKDCNVKFDGSSSWGGWGFSHSITKAGGFEIPAIGPEPSTIVLLCVGGVGLLGYAWRCRRR